MRDKDDIFFAGFFTGVAMIGVPLGLISFFDNSNQSNVQKGYVVPKEFSLYTEDLDRDGEDNVVARYDGKSYLFMEDENGNPVMRGYQVVTEFNQGKTSSKLEVLAECK